jgi:hypothetical protein
MRRFTWLTGLILSGLLPSVGVGAPPVDELLARVPNQANVVVVLDVKGAHESPLGKRQEWDKDHQRMTLSGISGIPPKVSKLVVGAELNPSTLENTWEVALAYLDRDITQTNLLQAVPGNTDSVAGKQIVMSAQNAMYVRFHSRVIGMMRPANRQAMSRWVSSYWLGQRISLSPFLRDAVREMPKGAQAMVAVELTDVFDEAGLRQRLKQSRSLQRKSGQIDAITKLFTGLNGFKLYLSVDTAIHGKLQLDFEREAASLAPVAKPLLLEALAGMGAAMDDLEKWEARAEGRSVFLEGDLSRSGARLILTPFLHSAQTPVFEREVTSDSTDPKAAASQRYYRSVRTLLNDLKSQKAKTFNQLAYWYSQFADKIDALPILDVDEDLQKYGASVSTTLRGLGNLGSGVAMRQKGIQSNMREGIVQTGTATNYYGYGPGWGYNFNVPDTALVNNYGQAQNMVAQDARTESAVRQKTWRNIEEATTDIRQKMVAKYKVEF